MWVEGEVRGGGRWGNRWHLTSKLGQLNLDSVLSTLFVEHMFLQDVIHVCGCHVRNLETILFLHMYTALHLLSLASYH